MSKIKNFFVRSETIKNGSRGLVGYVEYLENMEHKNHKDRTNEIINIVGNNNNFLENVVNEANQLQFQRDKAKKGGRPISSLAQSFVFSMPSDFVGKPTKKELKEMSKDMLKVIADKMDLKINDLKNHIKINVHMNDKNPHINILVGRIINGVNYQQQLTRPSTTNALKRESVRTVKRVLGLDIGKYKPLLPPGTTKGARWDELNKMNNFKVEEKKDFFKRLAAINIKIKSIVDDVAENIDQNSELFKSKELELKKSIKSLKSKHKDTFDEIKNNKNVSVDYGDTFETIKETNENIQELNKLKKTGRKIRSLGLSM